MPKVSAIVPVYNGASYLSCAIDSIRAQTLQEWELVIVDDGSTDASGDIARTYAVADRRIRAVRQPNGGVAVARNRGLAEVDPGNPGYVFLDSDDYWQPDALQVMSTFLNSHPNAVAVHGLTRFVDASGTAVRGDEGEQLSLQRYVRKGQHLKRDPSVGPLTFATLARRNVILSSGAVLIRGDALRRVGGFDQSIAPVADWDMWLRLCRLGEIGLVNRVVLSYRQHGASMSQDFGHMLTASRALFRKHLAIPGHSSEQAHLLRIGRRYRWRDVLGQRSVLARRHLSQRQWSQAFRQLSRAMGELT